MGRIGKNRAYISASAPKELVALIDERVNAFGWSRAQYTIAVLEKWRTDGSPLVFEPDKHMQLAKRARTHAAVNQSQAYVKNVASVHVH